MDNVEVISLPGSASYEYSAPVDEAEEKPEVDSPVTPDPITAPVAPIAPERPNRTANERRALIRKINRYKTLFEDELRDLDFNDLNYMSPATLTTLLEDCQFIVETRQSVKSLHHVFLGGINVLEKADSLVGLKLKGLTDLCASSPDLLQTVNEAGLKYQDEIMIDPIARIGIIVGQLVLALDTHNRKIEMTMKQENVDKPQKQDLINKTEEFSDL